MSEISEKKKQTPMEKVAAFIVDKRKAFYLIYAGLAIFCVIAWGWVNVNNDITTYLPEETETRRGLSIMNDEFTTFASSRIMIDNISYDRAGQLAEQLEAIPGIKSITLDDSEEHYKDGAALLSVTFDGEAEDQICLDALDEINAIIDDYDVYISGDVGASTSETIAKEMQLVMLIAVAIILLVLLFTSHTYMEIPVLLMTFGMAALLNMGTNFIFGTISFISNSIAVVLQLALAIDYAIILCHRYTEERAVSEPREAVIAALSKASSQLRAKDQRMGSFFRKNALYRPADIRRTACYMLHFLQ